MRKLIRDFVVLVSAIPWTIAYWCMVLVVLGALLAERLDPTARRGNCWSFGLPRLVRTGGYLAIKLLDDTRVLGVPVPHCIHVVELPEGTELTQTRPVKRRPGRFIPWWTYLFDYKLTHLERKGNESRWGGL